MNGAEYDRFLTLIDRESHDDCWVWTGTITADGYGVFGYSDENRWVTVAAHRAAYELDIGPIPEGFHVDHTCRLRSCVNPEHLEAVAPAENTRRGRAGILR